MKTIEKCTLTDSELIEKAKSLVNKLAKTGGKSWSLRVPVDFNNDPDMIFIELCNRLDNSQQQIELAVDKALEIASENAKTNYDCPNFNCKGETINKQSILSLRTQILNEIKDR